MDQLTEHPARTLLNAITLYLRKQYPMWDRFPDILPAGLRLEMHPDVYYTIMRDPYTLDWPTPDADGLSKVFRLPVKVTPDLDSGHWRLVVVTEDVKLGGTL